MPRRKRHFLHPARPCGPRRRRHKGKEGPGAPAGLPPGAARRTPRRGEARRRGRAAGDSRDAGPRARVTVSPPTSGLAHPARSPRAGSPAPHNGLGTRRPPSGASGRGAPVPPHPGQAGAEVRAVPALPPVAPARPLLPFGVFRLLLIVSVYSARVLVVQLEALLAGRRLAVLRHRGGSERLGRRRSERQARSDRAGAAAAPSSAAHPRALECGARGHAHPAGPAHRGRPRPLACGSRPSPPSGPPQSAWAPPTCRVPLQGLARLSRPLPPTSAAMAPPSSPAHFRLFQRVRRHRSRVRASASAAEAPPIPLARFGRIRPTLPRPPRWSARAHSAGAAPPTWVVGRARPGLPFPPQSRALRCERGGGARLASRARGRRGWGVACPGLRS